MTKREPKEPMDLITDLDDWENGLMDFEDETALFQQLVDNGMAWALQGSYGRRAKELIEQGAVVDRRPSFAATGNIGKQVR